MNRQIDISRLVELQKAERYKALIILGNLYNLNLNIGKKLSDILQGSYINLIDEFIRENSLNSQIDVFDCNDLKDYLKKISSSDVIVVDGIDMLWCVWSQYEKERFLKMVEKNTISPLSDVVFIFLCIKNDVLSSCNWHNTFNLPRVVDLDDIRIGGK